VRVRLIGVGVSNLGDGDTSRQLTLDAPLEAAGEVPWSDRRWEDVDRVADAVADRFGDVSVSFAALLDDDHGDGPWATKHEVAEVAEPTDDG
jgi:DNA polymerase IV